MSAYPNRVKMEQRVTTSSTTTRVTACRDSLAQTVKQTSTTASEWCVIYQTRNAGMVSILIAASAHPAIQVGCLSVFLFVKS